MTGHRSPDHRLAVVRGRGPAGFTLIEVVLSVALMAIVLAPVLSATLALQDHSGDVGRRLAEWGTTNVPAGDGGQAGGRDRFWSWSAATVEDALWTEDGLRVRTKALPGSGEVEVGWWVDGWFTGSLMWLPAREPTVLLPLSQHDPGAEIVVRAREEGGAWGIAWRILRGDASTVFGGAPAEGAPRPEAEADATVAVPHSRGAGISDVSASSSYRDSCSENLQLPGAVVLGCGWIRVVCDGREQSWWGESGSLAHAFF